MASDQFEELWRDLNAELLTEMTAWRRAHPRATLLEIEQALDGRIAQARALLLEQVAQDSSAADWRAAPPEEQPHCPQCDTPLRPNGTYARHVQTQGGHEVTLERTYGVCPSCGAGLFPLDEQLALLPGKLTPQLHAWLVRLSAWMPFARAAELLTEFMGVTISEATARRLTQAAGATAVALQTAEVARIEHDYPPALVQPERVVVSVDGAMVPLLHGEWAEVKTLVVGEPTLTTDGPQVAALSYFSRLADAETFGRLALAETHRRGVEVAATVAAVSDGAEWIQGFLDLHCQGATRILDFAHAAQRVGETGQALWGEHTLEAKQWIQRHIHLLKEHGARPVIAALQQVQREHPDLKLLATNLAYLEKRVEQMAYPDYRAGGWPIGSGIVESANKLVVEARLKGSGMHWARAHVDGMLALRNLVCNGRWQTDWDGIAQARRPQLGVRRQARRARAVVQEHAALLARLRASQPPRAHPLPPTEPGGPSRPAPSHPWRRAFQPHMRDRKPSFSAPTKL